MDPIERFITWMSNLLERFLWSWGMMREMRTLKISKVIWWPSLKRLSQLTPEDWMLAKDWMERWETKTGRSIL
jgi:hypothetical protein